MLRPTKALVMVTRAQDLVNIVERLQELPDPYNRLFSERENTPDTPNTPKHFKALYALNKARGPEAELDREALRLKLLLAEELAALNFEIARFRRHRRDIEEGVKDASIRRFNSGIQPVVAVAITEPGRQWDNLRRLFRRNSQAEPNVDPGGASKAPQQGAPAATSQVAAVPGAPDAAGILAQQADAGQPADGPSPGTTQMATGPGPTGAASEPLQPKYDDTEAKKLFDARYLGRLDVGPEQPPTLGVPDITVAYVRAQFGSALSDTVGVERAMFIVRDRLAAGNLPRWPYTPTLLSAPRAGLVSSLFKSIRATTMQWVMPLTVLGAVAGAAIALGEGTGEQSQRLAEQLKFLTMAVALSAALIALWDWCLKGGDDRTKAIDQARHDLKARMEDTARMVLEDRSRQQAADRIERIDREVRGLEAIRTSLEGEMKKLDAITDKR